MRIPPSHILIFIQLIFLYQVSFSQSIEAQLQNETANQYFKLYIHTDREIYFENDTIWFKAFYMDGQSQQLVPGIYSMYVELIDKNGTILKDMLWPISNGVSMGYFPIPDTLPKNDYLLRAFTDIQTLYNEDAFFHKTIKISKAYTSTEQSAQNWEKKDKNIDLAFLPEGGYLLSGLTNIVGIQATEENGKPIEVLGEIIDDRGENTANFATTYEGLGSFSFKPEEGRQYKAVVEHYPNYNYDFSEILRQGLKLVFVEEAKDEVLFKVTANTKMFLGSTYSFAIMHHGKVIFHTDFTLAETEIPIKVEKVALGPGVNRLILLDKSLKPISERLYFSDNYDMNVIKIKPGLDSYTPRSEVILELEDNKSGNFGSYSNLSLTIVDELTLNADGQDLDIRSWMLLDSELKGHLERPADSFVDDEQISSRDKLNLLMLTHGWSRYVWNNLSQFSNILDEELSEGITINGKVERVMSKKTTKNVEVDLRIFNNEHFINKQLMTDAEGRFSISGIFFTDYSTIFIQARNKKNKLSYEVTLDSIDRKGVQASKSFLPANGLLNDIADELRSVRYYGEMDRRAYELDSGVIMLDEVVKIGQKMEKDRHYRIYAKPQSSIKLTDTDRNYPNPISLLQRVPGVQVSGYKIQIHGPGSLTGSSEPLFLLNGIAIEKDIFINLPMQDIDVIEVLKDNEAAIYGTRAANGVISVFTKIGKDNESYSQSFPGTLSSTIQGYTAYREFYSPKYTAENIHSGKPDHRLTLYWNPNITTLDGKANLSFYTSDDEGSYRIIVEGITENGKICVGTATFVVAAEQINLE